MLEKGPAVTSGDWIGEKEKLDWNGPAEVRKLSPSTGASIGNPSDDWLWPWLEKLESFSSLYSEISFSGSGSFGIMILATGWT